MTLLSKPASVLLVNEDETVSDALCRSLSEAGHTVTLAPSGHDALEQLRERNGFQVMLHDAKLSDLESVDLVSGALKCNRELAIVVLSSSEDTPLAALCMQQGAHDCLVTPIQVQELHEAVLRALRRQQLATNDDAVHRACLRQELVRLANAVESEHERVEEISTAALQALVNALEAKNRYLVGHSLRVEALSATVASELGLGDDEIEAVRLAARLHDIGMIGVTESLLYSEDPLTDLERAHIKEHVTIGPRILAPLRHLGPVIEYVRCHHEHWDGSGYAEGLRGDEIPLGARIIGAAEVYDALTTDRSYHSALPFELAVDRMRGLAGSILDPQVTVALEKAVGRRQVLVFLENEAAPPA